MRMRCVLTTTASGAHRDLSDMTNSNSTALASLMYFMYTATVCCTKLWVVLPVWCVCVCATRGAGWWCWNVNKYLGLLWSKIRCCGFAAGRFYWSTGVRQVRPSMVQVLMSEWNVDRAYIVSMWCGNGRRTRTLYVTSYHYKNAHETVLKSIRFACSHGDTSITC